VTTPMALSGAPWSIDEEGAPESIWPD
jgi:hypothetical protein